MTDTADWERDFWLANETDAEHAERVEATRKLVNDYFEPATACALREFHDTVTVIKPYHGAPRWERMLKAAKAKYAEAVAEAANLYDLTAAEVMQTGEVSEETSERWDELRKLDAVRSAMEAA